MKIKLSDHFSYRSLMRFVLPSIIMMTVSSVYGIVDGFFVSNFIGDRQFTALNFIMPVVMILGGLGFIVGTGGSALVAKILGEGNRKKANQVFSMLIYVTVFGGIVLSVLGILFIRPITLLIGAEEHFHGHSSFLWRLAGSAGGEKRRRVGPYPDAPAQTQTMERRMERSHYTIKIFP